MPVPNEQGNIASAPIPSTTTVRSLKKRSESSFLPKTFAHKFLTT